MIVKLNTLAKFRNIFGNFVNNMRSKALFACTCLIYCFQCAFDMSNFIDISVQSNTHRIEFSTYRVG